MRGDGVGQPAGLVDARQRRQDLGRDLLVQLHVLIELRDHRAAHRLELGAVLGLGRDRARLRGVVGLEVGDRVDARALDAFDQHLHGAVGQLQHLQDVRDGAGAVHVLGRGLVLGGGFLRHQQDALARLHRRLQRLDRLRAPDEQRNHHVREDHHVTQRKQRESQCVGPGFGVSHVFSPEELACATILGGATAGVLQAAAEIHDMSRVPSRPRPAASPGRRRFYCAEPATLGWSE